MGYRILHEVMSVTIGENRINKFEPLRNLMEVS